MSKILTQIEFLICRRPELPIDTFETQSFLLDARFLRRKATFGPCYPLEAAYSESREIK